MFLLSYYEEIPIDDRLWLSHQNLITSTLQSTIVDNVLVIKQSLSAESRVENQKLN